MGDSLIVHGKTWNCMGEPVSTWVSWHFMGEDRKAWESHLKVQ